jgi:hypothetical protein
MVDVRFTVVVKLAMPISNPAMSTTALMLVLFPGVERLVEGDIAGGVLDPDLRVGDVVLVSEQQWAFYYQNQLYAKEVEKGVYVPVDFDRSLLVGEDCGGWGDGSSSWYSTGGDHICNYTIGVTSNFKFMFPKTAMPRPDETGCIAEGETRKVVA